MKYSYIFLYPVYNKLTISGTNPGIGAVTSLSLKENTNYTLNFELTYSSSPSDIMVTLKDQNQATIYSGNSTNGAGLNTLALNLGTFTNPLTLEITNNNNNQIFELDNITLTQDGIAGVSYYTAQLVSAQDYYPFGTTLPGRTFQDDRFSGYRFSFNGMEKDDEINGDENWYSFGDYGYDARLAQRPSPDPEWKKYPNQSSYSTFNGNPILFADPKGKSGEVTMDKESKTITVSSHLILYGSGANKFLATTTANDIQKQLNAANGKVSIDGVEYSVKFSVTAEFKSDGLDLQKEIQSNRDLKNNYFRVENETNRPTGVSYTDAVEGNTGEFKRSEIAHNGSTTEAHEYTHGLGLKHNSYYAAYIKGQPDIMDTRGDYAEKSFALPDGTLNIDTRKVTQNNINNIFTDKIKKSLSQTGKAKIGSLTNDYHGKKK